MTFFFLLHGIGDVTFAALKLSSKVVGRDVSITLIAFFLPVFCYCGLLLYYSIIVKFLKGYSRMMAPESREKVEKRFALLLARSLIVPILSVVPCVMPLIGIAYPQFIMEFGRAYLIGNGLLALLYGIFYFLALGFLLQELSIHMGHTGGGSEDIRTVHSRLLLAYRVGSAALFTIGFSYCLFGSSRVLLRKSSYLFLVIQITTHPTFTILILTISRITHNNPKIVPDKTQAVTTVADDRIEIYSKRAEQSAV
jgi:hypothetical protein